MFEDTIVGEINGLHFAGYKPRLSSPVLLTHRVILFCYNLFLMYMYSYRVYDNRN